MMPVIPQHKTKHSAGADVSSRVRIDVKPGECKLIPTGSRVPANFPGGCFLALYARSSIAFKKGLMLANGVGVIDKDYTGEIQVMLFNPGKDTVTIGQGERIAQLIVQRYEQGIFPVLQNDRMGGIGSTND